MGSTARNWHRRIDRKRWAITRRRVFERDGHRCRACGAASRLECDHVTPVFQLPDDADLHDLEGLQTLCRTCHILKTKRENKAEQEKRAPQVAAWGRLVDALLE